MADRGEGRTPLSYVVLALLIEQPMHAYGLHKLMLERGQDALVNIERRNSVQQVLDRLRRDGRVQIADAAGSGRRVVYRATAAGRELLLHWLRDGVARPRKEFPSLPVAISLIAFLSPAEVRSLLVRRRVALIELLAATDTGDHDLPPVLVLEIDLGRSLLQAEVDWVDRTLDRLDAGALTWDPAVLLRRSTAARHLAGSERDPGDGEVSR